MTGCVGKIRTEWSQGMVGVQENRTYSDDNKPVRCRLWPNMSACTRSIADTGKLKFVQRNDGIQEQWVIHVIVSPG